MSEENNDNDKVRKSTLGQKFTKTATKEVEGQVVGRNRVIVPKDEVFKLAQIGCKNQEIADWFGVDENTLTYNFSEELLKGRENLKQSLRRAQLKLALSGNATMLIWLGKNILGQSDNPTNTSDQEPLPWADSPVVTNEVDGDEV
jgi:hypothetical protein